MQEIRTSILIEASTLPSEKHDIMFLGIWSIKDLLAHLVGWDYTNIEAAKNVLAGKLPEFYVTIQRLLEAEAKDEQVHYQQIRDFFEKG